MLFKVAFEGFAKKTQPLIHGHVCARFYILCFIVRLRGYIQKESLIHHLNVLSAPNGNMEKVKNANSVDASKASGVAATVLLMA